MKMNAACISQLYGGNIRLHVTFVQTWVLTVVTFKNLKIWLLQPDCVVNPQFNHVMKTIYEIALLFFNQFKFFTETCGLNAFFGGASWILLEFLRWTKYESEEREKRYIFLKDILAAVTFLVMLISLCYLALTRTRLFPKNINLP